MTKHTDHTFQTEIKEAAAAEKTVVVGHAEAGSVVSLEAAVAALDYYFATGKRTYFQAPDKTGDVK